MPFISPDKETKKLIELQVDKIIKNKRNNLQFDFVSEQKVIDEVIFNFYAKKFNFSLNLKKKLDEKFSIYQF